MMHAIVLAAVVLLAYSNGANDNFKGVASLFGSGAATYRKALAWATCTTAAGALAALWFGQALVARFSGRGIVPDQLVQTPEFAAAVAIGAGLTVIAATFTGFPVSTTHALTGAIVGAGLAAPGSAVHVAALGKGFLLPLLLSPVLAVATVIAVSGLVAKSKVRNGTVADALHFASAGAVGFARGLNDAPKIAAVLFSVGALSGDTGFLLIAAAMAIGGLLHSRKIAATMSQRITTLTHQEGLAANASTALLVLLSSFAGLPVSTTHVSVGALVGIGLTNRHAGWSVIRGIVLSWVLTLPCGALFACCTLWWLSANAR